MLIFYFDKVCTIFSSKKIKMILILALSFLVSSLAEQEERNVIINGYDSQYRKFYVQLDLPNDVAECGGTIIEESFILIAAHCVYEQKG